MNIKKIKEIKHLLPQDCWIVMRNNVNYNEMDEEYVLHIESDFETENFDLGAPLIPFENRFNDYVTYLEQEGLMLILIEGNFTAHNVYNYETDGSTGLMVLGNASINNLVVGGQEIYIAQNLTVNECFWGHYNHGVLIVHGELKTKVFIATEEYHYPYEKEIVAEYFIKDDNDEDNYEPTLPKAIFVPELIEEIDEIDRAYVFSFAQWLNREAFIEHLVANKAILQAEIIIITEEEELQQLLNTIPKQFGDSVFSNYATFQQQIPNFKKLFEIARLHKEDAVQVFEWNDYSITISCQTKADELDYILATHINGLDFYIELRKISGGFLRRATETLNAVCKALPEQEFFSALENDTPKEIVIALQQLWTAILLHAERGFYFYQQFLATVKCEDLLAHLATPVVQEKYNDYWDGDKNGFWYGDYIISVMINGARDLPGSVDIGKEIKGNEFDIRKYYFRPNDFVKPEFVELYYISSQEHNKTDRYGKGLEQVFLYDWKHYQEALKWYPKIELAIAYQNKWYAEKKEEILKNQQEIADKKTNPKPLPFTEIVFEGITFKAINLAEADALIGGLTDFKGEKIYNVFEDTWRFPNYEENCFFLLAEEDVSLEKFDLDYSTEENPDIFILGFIFLKNLKTEKYILACDTDNSPALIVLGNVETVNIHLFGNIHYIGDGLQCDTLWGFYNHGKLFIKGVTTAWLIYADDMDFHIEKFGGIEAVISKKGQSIQLNSILEDTDGSMINVENYFPSTHRLSDIVVDGFVVVDEYGVEGLSDEEPNNALKVVQEGMSLIDHDKKDQFEYADFPQRLKKMFAKLISLDEVKTNNSITKTESDTFSFSLFTYQGIDYQQLMVEIGRGYSIRMRTLLNNQNQESLLLLEYLDEDGEPKYQWQDNAESKMLEMKCVKKAMIDAYERLVETEANETENPEINIDITSDGIKINTNLFTFPLDVEKLKNLFGEPDLFELKQNNIYTWQKAGVYVYMKDKKQGETFAIALIKEDDFQFLPKELYQNSLKIESEDYQKTKFNKAKKTDNHAILDLGNCSLFVEQTDEDEISSIQISAYKAPAIKIKSDKYKFQKIEGEPIVFADFNFKLAVIQVLMYEKELLKPKFDLYDFVKNYAERAIDIEEEGYEFIPEVTAYFEKLEIDKTFADEITEIWQSGGDNIYGEVLRFWDGEDDTFNIKNFEDIKHFKNLKKMELFYDEQKTGFDFLMQNGIDVSTF